MGRKQQHTPANFNKWLVKNELHTGRKVVLAAVNELSELMEFIPNLQVFLNWLCEVDDGFLREQHIRFLKGRVWGKVEDSNFFTDLFIEEFEKKISQYSNIERSVFILILLSLFKDRLELSTKIYKAADKERSENNYLLYSEDDFWANFHSIAYYNHLISYYELEFNLLKNNLPFSVESKIDISPVGDGYPELDWYIQLKENIKIRMEEKSVNLKNERLKPIRLNMEQRQIIYLFQELIREKLLIENNNPSLWNLISKYFVDKDGKTLKSIHQNKDGLKNSKTGKPKRNASIIADIVAKTKNLK